MKYNLSDSIVINKIGKEYFLTNISKSNEKYKINYPLFSILFEIQDKYLSLDEIFQILEKKFVNMNKNSFIEKTEPLFNELYIRSILKKKEE